MSRNDDPFIAEARLMSETLFQGPKLQSLAVDRRIAAAVAWLLVVASGSPAPATLLDGNFFHSLGVSADAHFGTALNISADGSTVVGAENGAKRWGFRWTQSGGIQRLSDFVGDAQAVSADGTAIVGLVPGGNPAYRWNLGIGVRAVPYGPQNFPPDRLTAISADGQKMVGYGYHPFIGNEIFTWTVGQPALQLVPHVAGTFGGFAYGTSDDASVIVGTQVTQITPRIHRAARWVNGVGELLDMLPTATASEGWAVSADGMVIGGSVATPGHSDAYIWTAADGMKLVGATNIGLVESSVSDLSADGIVAVGAGKLNGQSRGFYWTPTRGIVLIEELLTAHGIDMGGYSVVGVNAVSDDGRTFVGAATSPAGRLEPFIARIPEPHSLAMALAVAAVYGRRRPFNSKGRRASPSPHSRGWRL